ncbi:ABC-type branched-chain amino acid transport system, substrate-binding protein [Bradyrhizobium erythrophlei]|uniref:ABC-type branched-chain amino acid transport system, substrate-binding protein n=1 Tax=Bradyrhizobium erythrophlei TaxID=1437360 RepID=A0A1M7TL20_9BRAD|nr:ABC transporter substrate-binding protein [Bradyrhizobium erythrophlei]SHN71439.1 ABC-type branched-chain amino acid transport system, substrate-binding protein [Bradyrhizobium erythrophlei]
MQTWVRTLVAIVLALASLSAVSERVREQGVTETEIRIGNLMPYSGNLQVFGSIGKAEAAYFEMINERGGINGRQVRFISYDDKSSPVTALELTRRLVEEDNVSLVFGSFGTPGNFAVRRYLNERQVPQLFIASGDDHLSDPSLFPWTMGWQPSFREEGRIYANYIQASYPGKRIVALWQNDQVGRETIRGLEDGLGNLANMIRVDIAYDVADEHLDTHVSILKQSGAEVFVFAGAPANAAKVIRIAAGFNWHPVFILSHVASSIAMALEPAGLDNASGVITAAFLKDANDPAWKGQQASRDWQSFVDRYNRAGGKDDGAAVFGYAAAETLEQVLKQCGNDLSRENIMKQAAALKDYQGSILLPGIKINTGPWNFRPIKHLRLVQFDGRMWQPIGDVLETAFSNVDR